MKHGLFGYCTVLGLFAVISAQQCSSPVVSGTMPVVIDGTTQYWAVLTQQTSGMPVSNGAVTVHHGSRGYLVSGCPQSFSAEAFATRFTLLGHQMNYTVDLSTVGCACNGAFYAVAMPGYSSNGQPNPSSGKDYYCDANDVGGNFCPEMDIMEANNAALQVTPHTCVTPVNKYYKSCDKSGCAQNSYKVRATGYGPGSKYDVDTTKPFTVSTTWTVDSVSGNLTRVTTVLSQPGKPGLTLIHTDSTCGNGYLSQLTAPLGAGMVPTLSTWGSTASTMSWLDIPPCSSNTACNTAGSMVVSGISLTKLS